MNKINIVKLAIIGIALGSAISSCSNSGKEPEKSYSKEQDCDENKKDCCTKPESKPKEKKDCCTKPESKPKEKKDCCTDEKKGCD